LVVKKMHDMAWGHGKPESCQYLHEHSFLFRSTVNPCTPCFTLNLDASLHIA
jgi:hypothetical protein